MKKKVKFTALVAVLMGASVIVINSASAAPYTVYFEGVSTAYADWTAGSDDPTKVGKLFSGWVTFDTANGDSIPNSTSSGSGSNDGQSWARAESRPGCITIVNGVCGYVWPGTPVVTGYLVSSPFAVAPNYRAIAAGSDWQDWSFRTNYRRDASLSPPNGTDAYNVFRDQILHVLNGCSPDCERFGKFTEDITDRALYINLQSANNLLLTSVFDLNAPPALGAVPGGQQNFLFQNSSSSSHCIWHGADNGLTICDTVFAPGSFRFMGSLISLYVAAGDAVTTYSCEGFQAPFHAQLSLNTNASRSIPLRAQTLNAAGPVGPEQIAAPIAVVQLASDTTDASDALRQGMAAKPSSDGTFRFDSDTGTWILNLSTSDYTTPGTYRVTLRSGDRNSYFVSPPCVGTFVRE